MSHQTDSEDDLSDADVSVRNPVTQGPETPYVTSDLTLLVALMIFIVAYHVLLTNCKCH